MFTLVVSEDQSTVICIKEKQFKMTGIWFCMSGLNESLLMVVILIMATKLPQNETVASGSEVGAVVFPRSCRAEFLNHHIGAREFFIAGSVLGIVRFTRIPGFTN